MDVLRVLLVARPLEGVFAQGGPDAQVEQVRHVDGALQHADEEDLVGEGVDVSYRRAAVEVDLVEQADNDDEGEAVGQQHARP